MEVLEILNLYAGLGGNAEHWEGHNITHIEINPKIAAVLQRRRPNDTVLIMDAHKYLLENYERFNFVWSSPPCQKETRLVKATRHKVKSYPDLKLYQEVIFLQNFFKGKWVVENVVPYYTPLIPAKKLGRHLFWSNFDLPAIDPPELNMDFTKLHGVKGRKILMDWLGIHFDELIYYGNNHAPEQVLRNCVHPIIGKAILEKAIGSFRESNYKNGLLFYE